MTCSAIPASRHRLFRSNHPRRAHGHFLPICGTSDILGPGPDVGRQRRVLRLAPCLTPAILGASNSSRRDRQQEGTVSPERQHWC